MKRESKLSLRSKKTLVTDSSGVASGSASGSGQGQGQGQGAGLSDEAAMVTAAIVESAEANPSHDGRVANDAGGSGNAAGAPPRVSSGTGASNNDGGNSNNSAENAIYGGGGGGGAANERRGKRARARAYIGSKVDSMLFRFQRVWDKMRGPMPATTIEDGGGLQSVAMTNVAGVTLPD